MSRIKISKEKAWEQIFIENSILEKVHNEGYYEITSAELNKYHEARLMAKFDYKSQLPKIFKDNHLAILPITRGSYIIGKFKVFEDLSYDKKTPPFGVEELNFIKTIDIENISSEMTALLYAVLSGILSNFFEEDEIFHTIGGRMGSGSFEFALSGLNIKVNGSQIEIDGGFESENYVYLVEVKNLIHDDFMIRQLYYPFRVWYEKLKQKQIDKKIRNIFLTYSDGLFYFREYEFENIYDPSSIRLIKEAKYSIVKDSLNMHNLENILTSIKIEEDLDIPFPQSNDLDKTINLCELLYVKKEMTKQEIADEFGFVLRQSGYYGESARYLELANYNNNKYSLSEKGKWIFSLPLKQRHYELSKLILSHEPFNIVMTYYLKNGENPSVEVVKNLIKDCKLYNVGKDKQTFGRRCSTIKSWVNWILDRVEA